jgi:hypothetical protein
VDTSPDYLVWLARTGKVIIADNRRTATAALDINHADLVICYRPLTRTRSPAAREPGSRPLSHAPVRSGLMTSPAKPTKPTKPTKRAKASRSSLRGAD